MPTSLAFRLCVKSYLPTSLALDFVSSRIYLPHLLLDFVSSRICLPHLLLDFVSSRICLSHLLKRKSDAVFIIPIRCCLQYENVGPDRELVCAVLKAHERVKRRQLHPNTLSTNTKINSPLKKLIHLGFLSFVFTRLFNKIPSIQPVPVSDEADPSFMSFPRCRV